MEMKELIFKEVENVPEPYLVEVHWGIVLDNSKYCSGECS